MTRIFQQLDFVDALGLIVFPVFLLACWCIFLFLIWQKRNPCKLEKRKEVPWGLLDVVFLLGTMLFAKFAAQMCAIVVIAQKTGLPPGKVTQEIALENASILVGFGVVFSIAQLLFAIFYLRRVQKSSWSDLGISWTHLKKNVGIGLAAGLMIIPLVLVLNVVLHKILGAEYSHQVMTMVRYSLLVTAVSTIVVAPLVEEFHFRVLLQGWLQRVHGFEPGKRVQWLQGDVRAEKWKQQAQGSNSENHPKPAPEPGGVDRQWARVVPWWPVVFSSLLFACMHTGQGAAPYALFAFALALGFLYRQTGSVVPAILVHVLLNLWSFTALVSSLD